MMVLALFLHFFLFSPDPDLGEVEWLLGRWVAPAAEGTSYEIWKKISDRQFQGVSYTTKGADTSLVETLQIRWHDGSFYYIADVSENAVPVYFHVIQMSDTSLICKNPQHDFPQKIVYKKRGDSLLVEISSGKKSKRFHFLKEGE